MAANSSTDLEDFPLSPRGSVSGEAFYEAFLQGQELFTQLPRNLIHDPYIDLHALVKELVAARAGTSTLFRRRVDADEALTRFWLSKARANAQWAVILNEIPQFQGIAIKDLREIGQASADVEALPKLAGFFAERGIVLLYEPALPSMKLDGAVFTLDSGNPVVCLSLRYSRLDIFWFTLMHELSHVVLHQEQLVVPITDDHDEESEDLIERQADRLARDSLISRGDWRNCSAKYDQSESEVIEFAERVSVHPAIVAGRLRREWNKHDVFAKVLNAVNVRKVLFGHD